MFPARVPWSECRYGQGLPCKTSDGPIWCMQPCRPYTHGSYWFLPHSGDQSHARFLHPAILSQYEHQHPLIPMFSHLGNPYQSPIVQAPMPSTTFRCTSVEVSAPREMLPPHPSLGYSILAPRSNSSVHPSRTLRPMIAPFLRNRHTIRSSA